MGQALEGSREDFLKMGMSMADVSDGMLGYLKIQTRLGNAQSKTNAELADGAKKYLVEQDALTKVTGISRKQQEDALEEAMRNQRFAATIDQLIAEGKTEEAKQLQTGFMVARAAGKDMAAAYADMSSGMMNTGPAQKALLDSQGEMIKQIDSIKNNAMPALATSQSALLGDMPKLEIDKEAAAQIAQTFNEGMGEEFKSAVTSINQLADQLKNQSGAALQQQMVGLLEDMRRSMQSTATASERLAQVASN
jgi:hypothetical protein